MQPSTYDIQREVEALRDIRRRSTAPGALALDPDLPNQSSPTSPTSAYWANVAIGDAAQPRSQSDDDRRRSDRRQDDTVESDGGSPQDDPFHLFWVPASLHPEIAPAEFRAFLKEHARAPPPSEDSSVAQGSSAPSSPSSYSSGLGRKKSMLSRQYRPSENDGVEQEENIIPLRRNSSNRFVQQVPQLTISDLQKLDELAEEASTSDDPSKLRNILRRSLSLNVSPSALQNMGDMPDMGDEADAPIIVPPPGQILRRAARTKIRKPGLPGDGGGHRFGSTRKGARSQTLPPNLDQRTSSDHSSSDHSESIEAQPTLRQPRFSHEDAQQRPESFSEEAMIFDAYARDEDEETPSPVVITASPPQIPSELPPEPAYTSGDTSLLDALGPVIHQPQPQHMLTPQASPTQLVPSRSPSPSEYSISSDASRARSPPSFLSSPPSPPQQRKEKDKKGLFGKWGGDKAAKKGAKEKDRDRPEKIEKEKDSSFFGSLFGGKKNREGEPPTSGLGNLGPTTGREAAQALLGASKSSKSYVPPASPSNALPPGVNNYSRYPIHVERAIYRLSHIKLANPRRPLYEQVLISNLMFWYLGIINKVQSPGSPPNGPAQAGAGDNASQQTPQPQDKELQERERMENERMERERAEQEREQREREQKEREIEAKRREKEMEIKKKESTPRRSALTKGPPGVPTGGRRNETPVKGPQYDAQHRAMEQEYGYGGYNSQGQQQGMRPSSLPPNMNQGSQYSRMSQQQTSNEPLMGDRFYYPMDGQPPQQQQSHQPRLPPGAMPPADQSGWRFQHTSSPRQQANSLPPSNAPPRRSRSPPPPHFHQHSHSANVYPSFDGDQDWTATGGGTKTPGRSLSATAVPSNSPPLVNGKVRKGSSAYAAVPSYGRRPRTAEGSPAVAGEEEDVPLAMYQQQRRQ